MIDKIAYKKAKELEVKKANRQQEEWITPTLLNGWEPLGESYLPQYRKTDFGVVEIRGTVKNGELGRPIFRLPEGYRVISTMMFIQHTGLLTNTKTCSVRVEHGYYWGDGYVTVLGADERGVSLDGISFVARGGS